MLKRNCMWKSDIRRNLLAKLLKTVTDCFGREWYPPSDTGLPERGREMLSITDWYELLF